MCGICGVISLNNSEVQESKVRAMMSTMRHRGPNDEGFYKDQNISFGFLRLSILDLSLMGHQPMIDESGRYVIIFNGEVYNYIELKEKLKAKGYSFNSTSDTEVILKSYIEWGEDCLNHFNGMWAFAIYDKAEKKVFISRDRFGIKPFYFYCDEKSFVFASEIPALLTFSDTLRSTNDEIIFDFLLTNRTNHTNNTFFKKIQKLNHGYKIKIDLTNGNVREDRWYDLSKNTSKGYQSSEEFGSDFHRAIMLQMRSDVPVGLCLSGGLDSSSIGAIINKKLGISDLHTFSAVYLKNERGDETEFISEFDGIFKNKHLTYPSMDSFLKDMDTFVSVLGEPVPGTSEYAEFKVMEIAKDFCTVLLNGQGVDEYMAGYLDFVGFFYKQKFYELKWGTIIKEIISYYNKHNSFLPVASSVFFSLPPNIKALIYLNKNNYIAKDFLLQNSKHSHNVLLNKLYNSKTLKESFINHFEYKFEHHLLWADKSGMHFSLETRFPFLDHNLVEKMLNTDTKFIYKNGVTKVILRDAMKGILSEKIRMRMDKVGYETPQDKWFRSPQFQELFLDTINSSKFKSRPYFNHEHVAKINKEHLAGKSNGDKLWKILHLELWMQKFIDKSVGKQ